MGSSGNSISTTTSAPSVASNPPNTPIQDQVPDDNNTKSGGGVEALTKLSDDQLAQLYADGMNTTLPNYLSDVQGNGTQHFVYAAGLNDKPMVLDSNEFNQYLKDNNIPNSAVMARSVSNVQYTNQMGNRVTLTGAQINQMTMESRFNYIGGKQGGNCYGYGTYFAANGGKSTGYGRGNGNNTLVGALNPNTAKIIGYDDAYIRGNAFLKSHPKFAKALGSTRINDRNVSTVAAAMGYNVISEYGNSNPRTIGGGDYIVVIDRKALVLKK